MSDPIVDAMTRAIIGCVECARRCADAEDAGKLGYIRCAECQAKQPAPEIRDGKWWWSWLHYGNGRCPGQPEHPRAKRQGACMDCWDRLVHEIQDA